MPFHYSYSLKYSNLQISEIQHKFPEEKRNYQQLFIFLFVCFLRKGGHNLRAFTTFATNINSVKKKYKDMIFIRYKGEEDVEFQSVFLFSVSSCCVELKLWSCENMIIWKSFVFYVA